MSDFLDSLVDRSFSTATAVQPRLASRFEPPVGSLSTGPRGVLPIDGDNGPDPIAGPAPDIPQGIVHDSGHGSQSWPAVAFGDVVHAASTNGSSDVSWNVPDFNGFVSRQTYSHDEASPTGFDAPHTAEPLAKPSSVETGWRARIDRLAVSLHQLQDANQAGVQTSSTDLSNRSNEAPPFAGPRMAPVVEPVAAASSAQERLRAHIDRLAINLHELQEANQSGGKLSAAGLSGMSDERPPLARARMTPTTIPSVVPALLTSPQAPRIVPEVIDRNAAADQPPTINVTIGRVEVKAVREPAQPVARSAGPAPAVMSLSEYLERRSAGGGR